MEQIILQFVCLSGRGQTAAGAPGPGGASRPVSLILKIYHHSFFFSSFLNFAHLLISIHFSFFTLQNIPPRAGVISVTPQSRPPPPSHPGAPRPIPEVHPGAPHPISDTHPGAPRPVPSAQTKPADLPLGKEIRFHRG